MLCIEADQDPLMDKGNSEPWKQKAQWVDVASIKLATPGRGNFKGTGLCFNWDSFWSWHRVEYENWKE